MTDKPPAPHAADTHGKCLSLKQPHKTNPVDTKKTKKCDSRFSFDITTDDLAAFQKGEYPVNTARSTEWAFINFKLWQILKIPYRAVSS